MSEQLLQALTRAPKVVERLLRVFPTERLDEQIERGRFTAREVLAHLSDYETTVLDRIRLANMKPGQEVPDYDPDQKAQEHGFHNKEVFHEAEVFESRRRMTVDYLYGLDESDMNKTFIRLGRTYTIREYVGEVLEHDMLHIEQLSAYLASEVATIL